MRTVQPNKRAASSPAALRLPPLSSRSTNKMYASAGGGSRCAMKLLPAVAIPGSPVNCIAAITVSGPSPISNTVSRRLGSNSNNGIKLPLTNP